MLDHGGGRLFYLGVASRSVCGHRLRVCASFRLNSTGGHRFRSRLLDTISSRFNSWLLTTGCHLLRGRLDRRLLRSGLCDTDRIHLVDIHRGAVLSWLNRLSVLHCLSTGLMVYFNGIICDGLHDLRCNGLHSLFYVFRHSKR